MADLVFAFVVNTLRVS